MPDDSFNAENSVSAIQSRQDVLRISFRRIFNSMGIPHDGHYAQCPKCKKMSLRIIQNSNRVVCKTCFRRPLRNIDFVMKNFCVTRDEAVLWLKKNRYTLGLQSAHAAQASVCDIDALAHVTMRMGNPFNFLCKKHNNKNKFRHDSIAVTHSLLLHCIYAHGVTTPVAGVTDRDTADWACDNIGLRYFTPCAYKNAAHIIKTRFYRADIVKTNVFNKTANLFCADKHILIPVFDKSLLVGLIATTTDFGSDITASLIPFAHYETESESSAVMKNVYDAIAYRQDGFDTWIRLFASKNAIPVKYPCVLDQAIKADCKLENEVPDKVIYVQT